MITFVGSGMYLGEIVSFSISGWLAENEVMIGGVNCGGWPSIFVLFGALGVMWFPFFVYFIYSTPAEHPTITKSELDIIHKGRNIIYIYIFVHELIMFY